MDLHEILKQMWQKKVTVIIITSFVFLLTIAISLTQPLKYSVTTRLLVVQNYNAGTDAYGIARSNQYLSNVLAQVVYSDAFYDQVMNSGFNISSSYFPANDVERRKFWLKMIGSRALSDTGMIEVVTYHQDKRFADQVNRAVAYILQTKNNEYHGLGDKVRVKVIDNSMVSVWPVKPNLLVNSLFGLFLGLILSATYIKLWPNQEIIIAKKTEPKRIVSVPNFEPIQTASVIKPVEYVNDARSNSQQNPMPVQAAQIITAPPPTAEVPDNLPVGEKPLTQAEITYGKQVEKKIEGDIANILK